MTVPRGDRTIVRPHTAAASPLRAWSAADQLVLDHLGIDELGSVIIVNDEFGALSVGLAEDNPTVWTDSIVSRNSIDTNLVANGFAALGDRHVTGAEEPDGTFDTVIVRIPKTSALLAHQLAKVKFNVGMDTRVVGTGMIRHIHRSTIDLFERAFGAAITTPARQKARLILAEVDLTALWTSSAPPPPALVFTTDEGVSVAEAPGVFSAGHLDVGTALLLEVMHKIQPESPGPDAVIADLGCGNGVIGTTLARRWPDARFLFVDASDMAVAAARETWRLNSLDAERASIEASDGLAAVPDASLDMVVTNPPVHQGHALDSDLTDRLMADAAQALHADAKLIVVAQRHQNLHTRLLRWFDHVDVPSKHRSHVVLVATGPKR